MAKQLQLTIPTPCREDWDAMTPVERGRFCDSCQKQVVDFSSMSDRQVVEFFKKPSTGSVCGRFMSDQLERDIEIPKKRIPWVKYFFQFALPAFLLSIKSSSAKAQGKVIVKKTEISSKNELPRTRLLSDTILRTDKQVKLIDVVEKKGICEIPNATLLEGLAGIVGFVAIKDEYERKIQGKVIDDRGGYIPGASIRIKGTRMGVVAGNDGTFQINVREMDVLMVSAAGMMTTQVTVGKEDNLQIVLQLAVTGQVVFIRVGEISVERKPKEKKIDKASFKFVSDTIQQIFKVFPSPVSSGSTLTIKSKKLEEGDYTVQLVSQSGQSFYQDETRVADKISSFRVNVPIVAAGSYFLVLANKKSGKKYTEKIIVQ